MTVPPLGLVRSDEAGHLLLPDDLSHLDALQRHHADALREFYAARRRTFADAIAESEALIAAAPRVAEPYVRLSKQFGRTGRMALALEALRRGARDADPDRALWRRLVHDLLEAGLGDEALETLARARRHFPDDAELLLLERLAFPGVFADQRSLEAWRARLLDGVRSLTLDDPALAALPRRELVNATARLRPFYLDYLGDDSSDVLGAWGRWLCAIVEPRASARPLPRAAHDSRPRIAFVSDTLRRHVVSELFAEWITGLDPARFDVRCYAVQRERDELSASLEAKVARFVSSEDVAVVEAAIREDAPDAIIYLDIGLSPGTSVLAAQRLAPVQCVTWGHPITSGLPTVDYFLTGDAVELAGAEAHYTERLVRLPGLGTTFRLPEAMRPLHIHRRADFGIGEGEVAFLCAQTISKFLPSFDRVLAEIARRLPEARFIFAMGHLLGADLVRERLAGTFREAGLDWSQHERALPMLMPIEFDNLVSVCDALLDPIGWSAGYTAVNAIAFGLPMLCLPGTLFRTRQSAAMLGRLGETRTIAASEAEYVEIAVRLARDPGFRASVRDRLLDPAARERLVRDPEPAPALAAFLLRAIADADGRPDAPAATV